MAFSVIVGLMGVVVVGFNAQLNKWMYTLVWRSDKLHFYLQVIYIILGIYVLSAVACVQVVMLNQLGIHSSLA